MLSEDVLFKALKDNLSKVSRKYIGTIAEKYLDGQGITRVIDLLNNIK